MKLKTKIQLNNWLCWKAISIQIDVMQCITLFSTINKTDSHFLTNRTLDMWYLGTAKKNIPFLLKKEKDLSQLHVDSI
jgi:hypothetical protein